MNANQFVTELKKRGYEVRFVEHRLFEDRRMVLVELRSARGNDVHIKANSFEAALAELPAKYGPGLVAEICSSLKRDFAAEQKAKQDAERHWQDLRAVPLNPMLLNVTPTMRTALESRSRELVEKTLRDNPPLDRPHCAKCKKPLLPRYVPDGYQPLCQDCGDVHLRDAEYLRLYSREQNLAAAKLDSEAILGRSARAMLYKKIDGAEAPHAAKPVDDLTRPLQEFDAPTIIGG